MQQTDSATQKVMEKYDDDDDDDDDRKVLVSVIFVDSEVKNNMHNKGQKQFLSVIGKF